MRIRWRARVSFLAVLVVTAPTAVVANTAVALAAPPPARVAVDPDPPPAAVDPAPFMSSVTAPGPTEVTGTIAADTVCVTSAMR